MRHKSIYFHSIIIIFLSFVIGCKASIHESKVDTIEQSSLKNEGVQKHYFLICMYNDTYFPKFLVDKCKNTLLELCKSIEDQSPKNNDELYKLSRNSVSRINKLGSEFEVEGSELEKMSRECLASEYKFIAESYGFKVDIEEMISNRDW